MLVESSAVERRMSPGHRLHLTVNIFLFSRIQIKKAVIGIRDKITHNISGCPGQFGTVGNPTCTYIITYLSVLTLAITSASSRCMHRLTIKLAAHFPYLTIITHGLTWKCGTGIISQFLSLSFVCP